MIYGLMDDSDTAAGPNSDKPLNSTLTHQTASGFLWLVGQTVGSKLFSFGTQIALARLLLPRDFGLIALAYTAVAFAGVIRQTGIQQILIQRHQQFRRWVNPAFWFELTVGIATAIILAVASPVAAVVFHSRALIGLILVIAAAAPLSPWFVIPTARLMIDMRFKAIALVNITYNLIAMVISIFLAWKGFGAYSFVVPLPIAGGIRAFWLWQLAKPRVGAKPQFRRWKFLAGDSGYMLATGFITSVMMQAGSLALGLMYSKAVVGQLFFASSLSSQVGQLLAQNMGNALLASLSKVQGDPPRQFTALLRDSRMLTLVGVPLCLFLAAIAKPLVALIYGDKWLPAVTLLSIMAIATAFYLPGSQVATSLQAQGKFVVLFRWTALQAAVFLVAVLLGSWTAGALGVALANLTFAAISGPVALRVASGQRGNWARIIGIYSGPFLTCSAAYASCATAMFFWPSLLNGRALGVLASAMVCTALLPWLAWLLCGDEAHELLAASKQFLGWALPRGSAQGQPGPTLRGEG
jgi:PST family polysaccharide transporter